MTSANSDESLVGFVLTNLRTKETKYYECAGATESSAMRSAEGQVQQMSYTATSPLLLNIAKRPTYFLSLKDSAGLVKMYAFIDVQQYQIVGTGSTIDEAQKNYVSALTSNEEVHISASDISSEQVPQTEGTIESIQPVVSDGNTRWYFKLSGEDTIYVASISASNNLPFLKAGDKITVLYAEKDNVREVSSIKQLAAFIGEHHSACVICSNGAFAQSLALHNDEHHAISVVFVIDVSAFLWMLL